jgi:hypothetical protein
MPGMQHDFPSNGLSLTGAAEALGISRRMIN